MYLPIICECGYGSNARGIHIIIHIQIYTHNENIGN